MNLLADASWLIRLERELRGRRPGPAMTLLGTTAQVFINPVSHCEFLCQGLTPLRETILKRLRKLPALDYRDSSLAAHVRRERAKRGKTIGTPDAFMAACAMNRRLRLLTGDKDFSGIPGLDWRDARAGL